MKATTMKGRRKHMKSKHNLPERRKKHYKKAQDKVVESALINGSRMGRPAKTLPTTNLFNLTGNFSAQEIIALAEYLDQTAEMPDGATIPPHTNISKGRAFYVHGKPKTQLWKVNNNV